MFFVVDFVDFVVVVVVVVTCAALVLGYFLPRFCVNAMLHEATCNVISDIEQRRSSRREM
jgi:hypothetical protein